MVKMVHGRVALIGTSCRSFPDKNISKANKWETFVLDDFNVRRNLWGFHVLLQSTNDWYTDTKITDSAKRSF